MWDGRESHIPVPNFNTPEKDLLYMDSKYPLPDPDMFKDNNTGSGPCRCDQGSELTS